VTSHPSTWLYLRTIFPNARDMSIETIPKGAPSSRCKHRNTVDSHSWTPSSDRWRAHGIETRRKEFAAWTWEGTCDTDSRVLRTDLELSVENLRAILGRGFRGFSHVHGGQHSTAYFVPIVIHQLWEWSPSLEEWHGAGWMPSISFYPQSWLAKGKRWPWAPGTILDECSPES